jgi:uncharacterized protein (DUF433 family)
MSHVDMVSGVPMIARRQVKVNMIINMVVRGHVPLEEVMEQYALTEAEVHAALAYYYDNRDFFDQQYTQEETLLDTMAKSTQAHQAEIRERLSRKHP